MKSPDLEDDARTFGSFTGGATATGGRQGVERRVFRRQPGRRLADTSVAVRRVLGGWQRRIRWANVRRIERHRGGLHRGSSARTERRRDAGFVASEGAFARSKIACALPECRPGWLPR